MLEKLNKNILGKTFNTKYEMQLAIKSQFNKIHSIVSGKDKITINKKYHFYFNKKYQVEEIKYELINRLGVENV